jgi:hypothetical protein
MACAKQGRADAAGVWLAQAREAHAQRTREDAEYAALLQDTAEAVSQGADATGR